MKTFIKMPPEYIGKEFDGDWQVTFYFDRFRIQTDVTATSGEQAIRYAEGSLPSHLFEYEHEEVKAELMGVYGEVTQ